MSNKIVNDGNYKIGDKVVRGKDWQWYEQDKGSIYGIIKAIHDVDDGGTFWISVKWINHKGLITAENRYRLGPRCFDLYFYEQ